MFGFILETNEANSFNLFVVTAKVFIWPWYVINIEISFRQIVKLIYIQINTVRYVSFHKFKIWNVKTTLNFGDHTKIKSNIQTNIMYYVSKNACNRLKMECSDKVQKIAIMTGKH